MSVYYDIPETTDALIFVIMLCTARFAILFVVLLAACRQNGPDVHRTMNGKVHVHDSFPSRWVDSRTIWVWLPSGYTPEMKYAVLYMHDGQMLFDSTLTWTGQEWQVDETMSRLLLEKKIKETIVVGISNNGVYRWSEYLPQMALDQMPGDVRKQVDALWLRDRLLSDAYLRFITSELKPFIDSTYSTLTDRSNTLIMGSSMGGIISLYAICQYPEVFGGAGCLSSHWPLDVPGLEPLNVPYHIPSSFINYLAGHLPSPEEHRLYFDFGTESLDALYKPFQEQVDSLMVKKGFTHRNWITKEFPGEGHSEEAWARRLHIPLQFLLGD